MVEHLGLGADTEAPWPTYDGAIYIPKPYHVSPDTIIHVDELPYGVGAKGGGLPIGEVRYGPPICMPPEPDDAGTSSGLTFITTEAPANRTSRRRRKRLPLQRTLKLVRRVW